MKDYWKQTDDEMDAALAAANRTKQNIGGIVLDFLRSRMATSSRTFYVRELHEYVSSKCSSVAPASADRILRMLRQDKKCDYTIVSRADSHYEVTEVDGVGTLVAANYEEIPE